MRQFDVYANPSKTTRKTYPFIVDIQSEAISGMATRVVVPLVRKAGFKGQELKGLTPAFEYEGEELLFFVPQLAAIPVKALERPIGSLSHLRDEIIAAVDFAITGI